MISSTFPLRIYWEDTDAGGIVYYANYLKFAERARTEVLRALGIGQWALGKEHGITIVVTRAEIDYKRPAKLDDLLHVETQLQELGKLRMTMRQCIRRGEEILAEVKVTLASVNTDGRPSPLPDSVRTALQPLLSQEK